jgi:hypothetical protein
LQILFAFLKLGTFAAISPILHLLCVILGMTFMRRRQIELVAMFSLVDLILIFAFDFWASTLPPAFVAAELGLIAISLPLLTMLMIKVINSTKKATQK